MQVSDFLSSPIVFGKTKEQIQSAIDKVDTQAIIDVVEQDFSKNVTVEIWDQKTNVNNLNPDILKSRWLKIGFWDGVSPIKFIKKGSEIILVLGCDEDVTDEVNVLKQNQINSLAFTQIMTELTRE